MEKKTGYNRFTMRFTINNWKKRGIIDFQWDLLSLMGKKWGYNATSLLGDL